MTPIHIQRETAGPIMQPEDNVDDETEVEDVDEEDIYSPGTVSLPNLSPISSTTSSPHRGLSPDPSHASWTPADEEETVHGLSEGNQEEEVDWDKLEDARSDPNFISYKVHIEVEGQEDRIKGNDIKGYQGNNIKGQNRLPSASPFTSSERFEAPPSCQSKPPPASRTRHPVRIVPISLQAEQVCSSPDSACESQTKESGEVNAGGEGEGNTNVYRRGGGGFKRRSESGGDAPGKSDIPVAHHKRASSLDAAAGRKVWSIPINMQPRQVLADTLLGARSELPTKMGSAEKIPTERCDRAAWRDDRVGRPNRENETAAQQKPKDKDQKPRKISVPVRLLSEERELGSILVHHQTSEERLWGVQVPEQVPRAEVECTKESTNQPSQQGRLPSKKAEPATKDDTAMFASASNLPFGPTHKSPKNCGDNPLTIDPFVHTHLPFNLPNGFSSPPSPVRSVPIQREGVEQNDLGNKRESKSQSNFSGPDELNRLHDGLEVFCINISHLFHINTFAFISY